MQLTENMIAARAKTSDLSSIKRINLWGCDLTDISIIGQMINIEILALSINCVSCLKPLENCKKLQELYLRQNNIECFSQLAPLQNLPLLNNLWLAENPCSEKAGDSYRGYVVRMLPNLKKLDDIVITQEDIEMAKKLDDSIQLKKTQQLVEEREKFSAEEAKAGAHIPSTSLSDANKRRSVLSLDDKLKQLENSANQSIVPELNLKKRNSNSVIFDRLQSPRKSVLSDRASNGTNHAAEILQRHSLTSRSDCPQSSQKEVQSLDTTRSLNPIPNFSSQQTNATGLELSLQTPRSVSLQAISECSNRDEEKRDQRFYESEAGGDQTARSRRSAVRDRSTPRSRSVSVENISKASTARLSQVQQTEQSGNSRVSNNNSAVAENISKSNSTARLSQVQSSRQNVLRLQSNNQAQRFRNAMGNRNDTRNTNGNPQNNLTMNDGFYMERNNICSSSTYALETTALRNARRRNLNLFHGAVHIVSELSMESLRVLQQNIQSRLEELYAMLE